MSLRCLGILVLGILAVADPARAQTDDALAGQKRASIEAFIEISGAEAMGDQIINQMIDAWMPVAKTSFPQVPPDVIVELLDEMRREMIHADLTPLIIPIYDRHFTAEDIEGLLAFYRSPLGQRMIEKMPIIMQESFAVGQAWGSEIGERIGQRFAERLLEEGYMPSEDFD